MQTDIQLPDTLFPCRLSLAAQFQGAMLPLALEKDGVHLHATREGVRATLLLEPGESGIRYSLSFESSFPTRVQLALSLPDALQVFHLIPCCIHGDNNLARVQPGHFPHLTAEHPGDPSCSPCWEFRADRAAAPLSVLCFRGGLAAISVNPYTPCAQARTTSREGFVRNGLFARLAHDGQPPACGVSAGYRNTPVTFINKDQWGVPTEHLACEGAIEGRLFVRPADDRRAVHAVVREVYEAIRIPAASALNPRQAVAALTQAFLDVNWQPALGSFANLHCRDAARKTLQPWRALSEIGWTGGGVLAYPLLLAGRLLGTEAPAQKAIPLLDQIADAYNPASGLLWDLNGAREGRRVNGWWSGYLVKDVHCAYTNASALTYTLKCCRLLRGTPAFKQAWLDTALKTLETVVRLQKPDGNFGYTFSTDRPAILDDDGFAGAWFIPALALAAQLTGDLRWRHAALKGLAFYHEPVRALNCCGTPMDTWKSPEQEGNLGFLRGARHLHELTGDPAILEMMRDSAHYEYLWRYAFRARPEFRPLAGSPWTSCGGSVTSVSNPHIHPMGLFVTDDLRYLADHTHDPHHAARLEDGVQWALNTVALYPDYTGYGCRGVLTERYCPSDGLTIETLPDGTPASLWFSYNGWAAAAVLEGLAETLHPH